MRASVCGLLRVRRSNRPGQLSLSVSVRRAMDVLLQAHEPLEQRSHMFPSLL